MIPACKEAIIIASLASILRPSSYAIRKYFIILSIAERASTSVSGCENLEI